MTTTPETSTEVLNSTTTTSDSVCTLFPADVSKCVILVYCKRISAILSILGCIFTLIIILLFKKYEKFTQRLVANLSLASLLFAVSFVISDFESTGRGLCLSQAALMTFGEWAVMMGAMVILLVLYCEICHGKDLHHREKLLLALCWLVPLVFAGLPFTDNAYGPAGVWCWMKNIFRWRFGAFYIWKGISDVIFFIGIIRIWYVLLRTAKEKKVGGSERNEIMDDIKTLRVYPIVYFLVFLCSWVNRIHNARTGEYNFGILLSQTVTIPLFGATVALTFVLDKKTRNLLRPTRCLDEIKLRWSNKTAMQENQKRRRSHQNPTFNGEG